MKAVRMVLNNLRYGRVIMFAHRVMDRAKKICSTIRLCESYFSVNDAHQNAICLNNISPAKFQ